MSLSRRRFLNTAAAATLASPYFWTSSYARSKDKNSRLRLGMIGCGGKGRDDAQMAAAHGDFRSAILGRVLFPCCYCHPAGDYGTAGAAGLELRHR